MTQTYQDDSVFSQLLDSSLTGDDRREMVMTEYVKMGLIECHGNVTSTAKFLGYSTRGLYNKMHEYGLQSLVSYLRDKK